MIMFAWTLVGAVLVAILTPVHAKLPPMIHIGTIFETGDEPLLKALNTIVDRINNDQIILPRSKLVVSAHFIKPRDSFNAARIACKLLQNQVWAVFSSKSESVNWYTRSLAKSLHVPHLSVNWDYRSQYMYNINQRNGGELANALFGPSRGQNQVTTTITGDSKQDYNSVMYGPNGGFYRERVFGSSQSTFPNSYEQQKCYPYESSPWEEQDFTISFYPEATQLSEAFMNVIESRNWKTFTLIYDTNEGLIRMKDLLRISNRINRRRVKISVIKFPEDDRTRVVRKRQDQSYLYQMVRQEDTGDNGDPRRHLYQKLLKMIKKSEHNFVLSIASDKVVSLLREAHHMKRVTEYDNFLIASLDIHTLDLSEFQHLESLSNITGLSLLSPEGQQIDLGDVGAYRNQYYRYHPAVAPSHHQTRYKLKTTEALIYDAVTLFARSLDDLDRTNPELIVEPCVSCNVTKQWPLGGHIVNYMRKKHIKGVTGLLMFDERGHRVNFTLDVLQLKKDGLKNVAKWTKDSGIVSTANYTFYDSYKQILEAMKYKELKVTVPPQSIPYIYLKENHEELSGNDKFDGFCVDLLNEIANVFRKDFQSDFKFSIRISADMKYGRPNKETGEWDGMIGELMRHQSDLAIADLTATYLRETAVDFTMPFMNLGIAILFKKPGLPEPELFSFLKPFSVEVWLYLASAFLGISLLLWMLSRISPYEWVSPHSCDPEPLELENQFSIGNSLWFTIGSLMQQGSDLAPRALSTRTLASVWWFFTLIMISSYTANLAASLTLSRMAPAISNVDDLAKQTIIQYGCKKGGSTHDFFQNSNHTTFQRMYNTMESNQEVYINKLEDAIERVRKGGYAYLAESSTIEYLVQRKCDLIQVGTWLDNKGYGIATPTDSPYRTPISNAIVVLQDRGILYDLKKRWWVEKGGGLCADEVKLSTASELNIENVGGVFVVLVAGVAIGCLMGAFEFIWKSLKIARDERESIGKLIWLEIVRICTGGGSSRPVYTAQSSTNNNSTNSATNPLANTNNSTNNVATDDGRPLTKASSFGSIIANDPNNTLSGYNSPYDYGQIRYPASQHHSGIIMPPVDSTIPLLSPSSAPSKSLSRVNNFGPQSSSPNSFKSQPNYTIY